MSYKLSGIVSSICFFLLMIGYFFVEQPVPLYLKIAIVLVVLVNTVVTFTEKAPDGENKK